MLPLTTHCRKTQQYEQYVLKEHLAYRLQRTDRQEPGTRLAPWRTTIRRGALNR